MPLHLKVQEVHRIEGVKASGVFNGLPADVNLECRLPSAAQLHPASRVTISPESATTQEEADSYSSPTNIFTDGSKQESGETGCAFGIFHPNWRQESRKFRLHECCTVFQAEVFAIDKAPSWSLKCASVETKGGGKRGKQEMDYFAPTTVMVVLVRKGSNTAPIKTSDTFIN